MKAIVRSVHLIDHENWDYWPDDPFEFCVAAEAMIGPQSENGTEIFSFEVCSPRWFERHRGDKGMFVRHVLLVNEYDEQIIKNAVTDIVEKASGATWRQVATKLARYMFWEFEDYEMN